MVVMSLIKEILPLHKLTVEFRATLRHEVLALLLEPEQGLSIDFVHNFHIVDNCGTTSRRASQIALNV